MELLKANGKPQKCLRLPRKKIIRAAIFTMFFSIRGKVLNILWAEVLFFFWLKVSSTSAVKTLENQSSEELGTGPSDYHTSLATPNMNMKYVVIQFLPSAILGQFLFYTSKAHCCSWCWIQKIKFHSYLQPAFPERKLKKNNNCQRHKQTNKPINMFFIFKLQGAVSFPTRVIISTAKQGY